MGRRSCLLLIALAVACGESDFSPPDSEGPNPDGETPNPVDETPNPLCRDDAACVVHFEAESFTGAWAEQTNLGPYYGRGFRVSNVVGEAAADGLETVVELPAGTYSVWTRGYRDFRDRAWRISVDGIAVEPTHGPLPMDEAAGFRWERAGRVDIGAGAIRIRIEDAGDYFEVADAIVLSSDDRVDVPQLEAQWRITADGGGEEMLLSHIVQRAEFKAARLPETFTPEAWAERRAELIERVRTDVGLHLEFAREAPRSQFRGEIPFEGYRIEKIVFESRPDFWVPAHVYVPDGDGPFPVVLSPVGHYFHYAKSAASVGARAHSLAKLGYLVLTYDPFGQGERWVPGNGHEVHWPLLLTGRTNMTLMVYDTVRALDYLATRPEANAGKVACTGASGGGLNTLFYSVADDRLEVAAPAVFVSNYGAFLGTGHGHDPCSLLPGLAEYTDLGEVAALFAPRPQLILAGEFDRDFPVHGAEDAWAQASVRYEASGAPDDVVLFVDSVGHQYSTAMRERLYGFVDLHLRDLGTGEPIPEPDLSIPANDDPELFCFEGGRVPDHHVTPQELAHGWITDAIDALPDPTSLSREDLSSELRDRLAVNGTEFDPELESAGLRSDGTEERVEAYRLTVEPGVTLPLWHDPVSDSGPVLLLVDAAGLGGPGVFQASRQRGLSAVHVHVRGRGETFWSEHILHSDYVILGEPLLGRRAYDLAQARRALRTLPALEGRPVVAVAVTEEAALAALAAQATLQPFDGVVAGPLFSSYEEATRREVSRSAYVHDVLRIADIPHLVYAAHARPLFVLLSSSEGKNRWPAAFMGLQAPTGSTLDWSLAVEEALKLVPP